MVTGINTHDSRMAKTKTLVDVSCGWCREAVEEECAVLFNRPRSYFVQNLEEIPRFYKNGLESVEIARKKIKTKEL